MKKKQELLNLPIDIQSFEIMREENYLYVDKTRHIHRMVTEGIFYFLSRPRRFGKSLLMSTLKSLFQGRQELFDSLWIIEQSNWDWANYPVIDLDFNDIPGSDPDELQEGLSFHLSRIAQEYGVTLHASLVELQFNELIVQLSKLSGKPVVVLIDEYDKRIIDHLGKGDQRLDIAKANRDTLKSFFGVLKGQSVSSLLRFVFLTGISRFSKVPIFSELNNLRDLTLNPGYADMLGYTQKELETCFPLHIEQMAQQTGMSPEQVLAFFERKYNGYRFSKRDTRVYNPYSILNALNECDFGDYWFETATPTFLIQLLKQEQYDFPELENFEMDQSLSTYDLDNLLPEAILLQTGYLTIKDVNKSLLILNYPNQEVKEAFLKHVLTSLQQGRERKVRSKILRLSDYLEQQDFDRFFETLKTIFASIPYDIQMKRDEAYFHTIFYLLMSASGMAVDSSVLTCEGRIDLVVNLPETLYIIEFKCNQDAAVALQQIQKKRYADRYQDKGKQIFLMGINFDTETHNLKEAKVEEHDLKKIEH